jgi:drug/metabolite transporter, DME family
MPVGTRSTTSTVATTRLIETRPVAMALVMSASTLWGASGLVVRELIGQGLTPLQIVYYSALIGGLALLAGMLVCAPRYVRVPWRAVMPLVFVGVVGDGFAYWANTTAVSLVGVSLAVVLLYTTPAWVALLAWRFLGEPLGARRIIAVASAMLGAVLVAQVHDLAVMQASLFGVLCGVGAGLGYAVYSVLSKGLLRRYHPLTLTMYAFIGVALVLMPLQPAPLPTAVPVGAWPWFLLLIFGSQLFGTVIFYLGLRALAAGLVSVLVVWQLVVGVLLGVALLGESFAPLQGVGILLIVASVLALSTASDEHQQSEATAPVPSEREALCDA